jgi:hypothetical protein
MAIVRGPIMPTGEDLHGRCSITVVADSRKEMEWFLNHRTPEDAVESKVQELVSLLKEWKRI